LQQQPQQPQQQVDARPRISIGGGGGSDAPGAAAAATVAARGLDLGDLTAAAPLHAGHQRRTLLLSLPSGAEAFKGAHKVTFTIAAHTW
jgi:hypothetical protein